jgi:FkbM family methyltransferase
MTHALTRPGSPQIDPAEVESVVGALLAPGCAPAGRVRLGPYELDYVSPRAFGYTIRLLFGSGIYDVDRLSQPERIIDGGGWLGLSVLRFRMLFPRARIVVFEPDPDIYRLMCGNLERNGIGNVETVRAALSGQDGQAAFTSTGSDSGTLAAAARGATVPVPTRRLSPYLSAPVSLLKLNIEGAEADVIEEIAGRLELVDQVLIEYHGFCELPQTLHAILGRLHEAGHTYLVSHFDETNRACVPPLRLGPDYRYFLLVYARRLGGDDRPARGG